MLGAEGPGRAPRGGTRPDAPAMDIRFCDICNESIAQVHFDEGRAVLREGHVACLASSGDRRSPSPEGSRTGARGAGSLWTAALAIAAATVAGFLAIDRVERLEARHDRRETADRATLAAALDQLDAQWRAGAAEESAARAQWFEDLAELRREASGGRVRIEELALASQSQLAEIDERLAALTPRAAPAEEARLAELTAELERLRGDFELLAGALLSGLEAQAAQSPAPGAVAAPTPARGHPGLDGLASADPVVRWDAVDQLVRSGDPELATVLLPLLRDADLLVRMGAARGLGSLGNPNAIPALIEALEDAEAPVREAAVFSLRLLTGLDLKYDPLAPAPDRARRVEAWRRWWERGGAEELDQNELRRP
jgi:hypothetical protein